MHLILKRMFHEPSKLLVNAVFCALFIFLVFEITSSVLKYRENMVGRSTRDMHERYVKFPSISVCFDLDTKKKKLEFKEFRPWNETFISLDFIWHHDNGYDHFQGDPSGCTRT